MSIGARVRLAGDRHGTIRYIGDIPELGPGPWVGLELDEPSGKNDGSVKGGTRYFHCEPSHGVFVRENRVEIGNFGNLGEEELLGSDMEEIWDETGASVYKQVSHCSFYIPILIDKEWSEMWIMSIRKYPQFWVLEFSSIADSTPFPYDAA